MTTDGHLGLRGTTLAVAVIILVTMLGPSACDIKLATKPPTLANRVTDTAGAPARAQVVGWELIKAAVLGADDLDLGVAVLVLDLAVVVAVIGGVGGTGFGDELFGGSTL